VIDLDCSYYLGLLLFVFAYFYDSWFWLLENLTRLFWVQMDDCEGHQGKPYLQKLSQLGAFCLLYSFLKISEHYRNWSKAQ
jgi:hypothetical protein